ALVAGLCVRPVSARATLHAPPPSDRVDGARRRMWGASNTLRMYESENSLISNLPWSSRALLRPKMFERLSCIFQPTPWRRCQAMNGLMSKSGTENGTAFSAVASSWRLGSRFSSEWPRWRFGEGRIIAVQLLRVRFWHEAAIRKCPLLRRLRGLSGHRSASSIYEYTP